MYKIFHLVNMSGPAGTKVGVQFRAKPRKTKNGLFAIDANRGRFLGPNEILKIAAQGRISVNTNVEISP
ncbi:hypothetical protein BK138_35485 [Paenibacillus rhizosphaerae]|uniref:Uncharacterized protein n=1 Tax=Paenibacillus rhizosphaerae TaxID=297318 RepID=A0A1R1DTT2_9BACL|nr:hypothetical protein BK138_35485 [Paenibacillus rhizosphaerae]